MRSGGYRPAHFDLGDLSDLFSAFFGDDLFGVTRPRRRRGADIAAEVEIDLLEAASGATREVRYSATFLCAGCGGNGYAPGTRPEPCTGCGGSGRISEVRESAFGQFVRTRACPTCRGAGHVVEHPCPACDGGGRVLQEQSLEVKVPAGIHDGQRIRISGEGHAGALGGSAGDVYVLVRVRPDPRFVREGNDVLSTVELTMTQAALGTSLKLPTLDGELELEFKPGTQPGETRVLRGRGMPVLQGFGRGDHRVVVSVLVPRRLSAEQRRLLEELEGGLGSDSYDDDEGFFDRLKSAFR